MHQSVFLVGWTIGIAIIGFLLGVIGDDLWPLEEGLLKWATLIAGCLAIIAGAITVVTMLWTDQQQHFRHLDVADRQQAQHAELMRLNLRADRLRIQRATIPLAEKSIHLGDELRRISYAVDEAENFEAKFRAAAEFNKVFGAARAFLALKEINDISDLFDPYLNAAFRDAKRLDKTVEGRHEKAMLSRIGEASIDAIHDRMKRLTTAAIEYGAAMDDIGKHLQQLRDEYA